jgi:hypothetical protein
MKKPLKYLGYGLIAFTIIGIIAVATDTSNATDSKNADEKNQAKDVPYTIAKKDKSGNQLDYKLVITDRVNKASLIETVRKLKLENKDWKDKLVVFFYIGGYSTSHAWASVAYLPECAECETDKDADGDPVRYELIGLTKAAADSLMTLSFDSIANKRLITSFVEDVWKCKTELYIVNNDESKLLIAQLFHTGKILQWLNLKTVKGEKRYYFEDEDPGDENYVVMDDEARMIHYKDHEDKIWQSYKY